MVGNAAPMLILEWEHRSGTFHCVQVGTQSHSVPSSSHNTALAHYQHACGVPNALLLFMVVRHEIDRSTVSRKTKIYNFAELNVELTVMNVLAYMLRPIVDAILIVIV